ncbi:DUF72 domain-containing protein [Pigmentiphaga litoralis]|uniref:DUF72 domain-containing protein n=1 Tax=Pigmentiphaga litoralis TaxID=516702 RepID=UPI003B43CE13
MRKREGFQVSADGPGAQGSAPAVEATGGGAGRGTMRIGCAGWSLSSRVADRFPGSGSHLERYARVFNGVEIDTSFYRPHRAATYARWRESVPDDFRFAVKLPRTITHEQRLAGIDGLLTDFLDAVHALGPKLGCLLVQLPPSLAFDDAVAMAFFATLRQATGASLACEPRHRTWFTEAASVVMASHGVSFVRADPNPVGIPPPAGGTEMTYVRLHGSPVLYRSAYPDEVLDAEAEALRQSVRHGQTAWVVFDNTAQGEAVPNALDLLARVQGGGVA